MNSNNFKVKSNTNILFNSMIEVIEIMDSNNIISFLNYGALLGYVREKRLLPWNNDVELCAYLNGAFKNNIIKVMKCLDERGYSVSFHEYAGTLSIKKIDVDINVNLLWKKRDKYIRPHHTAAKKSTSNFLSFYLYWLGSYMFVFKTKYSQNSISTLEYLNIFYIKIFQNIPFSIKYKIYIFLTSLSKIFGAKYLSTSFPLSFFDELKTVKFNGFNVKIPINSKDILIYLYGHNWNIPKKIGHFMIKKTKTKQILNL